MHQKFISKTSLTNMSAYFRNVFANNFYMGNFCTTFSTDLK